MRPFKADIIAHRDSDLSKTIFWSFENNKIFKHEGLHAFCFAVCQRGDANQYTCELSDDLDKLFAWIESKGMETTTKRPIKES